MIQNNGSPKRPGSPIASPIAAGRQSREHAICAGCHRPVPTDPMEPRAAATKLRYNESGDELARNEENYRTENYFQVVSVWQPGVEP